MITGKIPSFMRRALKETVRYNSRLNAERKEERQAYFDLQTQVNIFKNFWNKKPKITAFNFKLIIQRLTVFKNSCLDRDCLHIVTATFKLFCRSKRWCDKFLWEIFLPLMKWWLILFSRRWPPGLPGNCWYWYFSHIVNIFRLYTFHKSGKYTTQIINLYDRCTP